MTLDSIIDSLLLLTNACFINMLIISLIIFFFFFLIWEISKNMTKTIHENPKSLSWFFHKIFKAS